MKRECLEGEPAELICISSSTAWSAEQFQLGGGGSWGRGSDVFVPAPLGSSWSSQLPARFLGQVFQAPPFLPCFSLFCCFVFPFLLFKLL